MICGPGILDQINSGYGLLPGMVTNHQMVPTSQPPEREEKLEIELTTNGPLFNQSCLCNVVSVETQKDKSTSRQLNTQRCLEDAAPTESVAVPHACPYSFLYAFLPSGCSPAFFVIFFTTNG